jgi:protein-disulfide isomerase
VGRVFSLFVALGLTALALGFGFYAFERATRDSRSEQAVVAHADEVFRAPTSVVAGNPQGDVSVIAFFDYNCPYCRKDAPELGKLLAKDGHLRLVLKELPVLGSDSEDAARIALAAKRQGKSFELYQRLIGAKGRVTKARALQIADELGLDTARLERDMDYPAITATLLANTRLADALGVRGVPFYLVGDQVVPDGTGDFYDALESRVADVREHGCRAAC